MNVHTHTHTHTHTGLTALDMLKDLAAEAKAKGGAQHCDDQVCVCVCVCTWTHGRMHIYIYIYIYYIYKSFDGFFFLAALGESAAQVAGPLPP